MNKEVEEAKEKFRIFTEKYKIIKENYEDYLFSMKEKDLPNVKDFCILLNYIQELEETIKRYENELDLDYVDNNFIEKKVVQKLIHKERELAEAQTTYEVNKMWKEKIESKRDKYQNEINKLENQELWNEPVDTILHNRYINYYNILQELLNEEE